jgi:predicted phage tail protein
MKWDELEPIWQGHITEMLLNAEWTQEQIDEIDEDQLDQVVTAINNHLASRQDDFEEKIAKLQKENNTKYAQCMQVLFEVNQGLLAISKKVDVIDDEYEIRQLLDTINKLEAARWIRLKQILGDDFEAVVNMEL